MQTEELDKIIDSITKASASISSDAINVIDKTTEATTSEMIDTATTNLLDKASNVTTDTTAKILDKIADSFSGVVDAGVAGMGELFFAVLLYIQAQAGAVTLLGVIGGFIVKKAYGESKTITSSEYNIEICTIITLIGIGSVCAIFVNIPKLISPLGYLVFKAIATH